MHHWTDLRGRRAVVTGGASGIGYGIAQALIEAGAAVMIADVEPAALDTAAAALGIPARHVDVRERGSVDELAAAAAAALGGVDIVCNNAGIGPAGRIEHLSISDWQWMLDVNLWGVIHGVQAFLPLLKSNPDGGHIVNTASMSGLAAAPSLGAYAVSKFGVVALTEALSAEEPRIGTTVLCPGPVRSRIGASSRNRPAAPDGGALVDLDLDTAGIFGPDGPPWLEPIAVGRIVVDAIVNRRLYAITHPQLAGRVKARHAAIEAAFAEAAERKEHA
ncbi:short-chain type dehydrogenase/reductase [Sphingomonas metalli]|uniref:Short-chain type dehydrogenase/reductase n=1 Tax=Sphingomonas metalli TaxID=1779358 RepID=A0A916WZK0_9SPHN|nr:SDR family NAD(P)-dependent oxidoreductase [Sphingomonas metalli]GGB42950.1 short-chain type dehydrogenase/reductase [Sphingomonas metalli]